MGLVHRFRYGRIGYIHPGADHVVEAGAGPGTLARTLLAADPRCAAALSVAPTSTSRELPLTVAFPVTTVPAGRPDTVADRPVPTFVGQDVR